MTVDHFVTHAFKTWGKHLDAVLGFGLLAIALEVALQLAGGRDPGEFLVQGATSGWSAHLAGVPGGALVLVLLAARIRGGPIRWSRLPAVMAVELVVVVLCQLGFMLFFVPGLVLGTLLAVAAPLALDWPVHTALLDSVRLARGRFSWVLGTLVVLGLVAVAFGFGWGFVGGLISDHPHFQPITHLVFAGLVTSAMTIAQLLLARNLEGTQAVAPEVAAVFD